MSHKRMLQSWPTETIVLLSNQIRRVIWLCGCASERQMKETDNIGFNCDEFIYLANPQHPKEAIAS